MGRTNNLPAQRAKKNAFLKLYGQVRTVYHACQKAKIERSALYRWLKSDSEFAEQVEQVRQGIADELEREVIRRGMEGFEEPLVCQGKISMEKDPVTREMRPVTIRRWSDNLLMFQLKKMRPEYRDKIDQTVNIGSLALVNAITVIENASEAELLDIIRSGLPQDVAPALESSNEPETPEG